MRSLFLLVTLVCLAPISALAGGEVKHPRQVNWAFDGVLGKFDRPSIQRGLQVYREVCAACHGVQRVAFRSLTEVGFSEAEVKSMAAEYTVLDGPDDSGEMFDRPGRPSDRFPAPYPNEQAARAAQGGAYPLDLSLIVKARADGANYVYSLLTGYHDAPEGITVPQGMYYNPYFVGGLIAMAPPLKDGAVEYQDGTASTTDQMARDVVNFLQWAAEPEMETRKRMGVRVMIFLLIMTGFFYVAKKRIWSKVE